MSKVVIVTGASRGIGHAIATALIKSNHRVVLCARTSQPLEQLRAANPGRVEFIAGDMTKDETSQKLANLAIDSFGKLDGVVVNHGLLSPIARLENASIEQWRTLYEVNVLSGVSLAKAVIPHLRKTKGCVVWVSSGAALNYYGAWSAYGSSKAAVNSISGHLALEEPDIVSVSIGPGVVDTSMQELIREHGSEMLPEQRQRFIDTFNQGALLTPDKPGGLIARLVVDAKPSLSGQYLRYGAPEFDYLGE